MSAADQPMCTAQEHMPAVQPLCVTLKHVPQGFPKIKNIPDLLSDDKEDKII